MLFGRLNDFKARQELIRKNDFKKFRDIVLERVEILSIDQIKQIYEGMIFTDPIKPIAKIEVLTDKNTTDTETKTEIL